MFGPPPLPTFVIMTTRRPRTVLLLLTAGVVALAVSACTGTVQITASAAPAVPAGADGGDTRFGGQQLSWTPCSADGVPMDCTTVQVPVDWSQPDGPTLSLAVKRHMATGTRTGALLLNPGGPGGSGVQFVPTAVRAFSEDLVGAFDLVSWDPRGVGESSPLTCPDAVNAELAQVDLSPDTLDERTALERATAEWARACQQASGPVFAHVDTLSTVRDLDVLRAVLGEEKLHYAGFSYGTRIGLWYADTFPDKVGRMVLDSSVDPASDDRAFLRGQAVGAERALEDYLASCPTREGCPLAGVPPDQARTRLQQLIRDADRSADQTLMVNTMAGLLTRPQGWPGLDQLLTALLQGDTGVLDPQSAGVDIANTAINCLDLPDQRSAEQVLADAEETAADHPVFGHEVTSGTQCPQWPVEATGDPRPVTAEGAAPILVVGTTRDSATPYEWAQAAASGLASGRLLTREGSGHIAYSRDECVTAAVDRYLITGELPAAGTVCAP